MSFFDTLAKFFNPHNVQPVPQPTPEPASTTEPNKLLSTFANSLHVGNIGIPRITESKPLLDQSQEERDALLAQQKKKAQEGVDFFKSSISDMAKMLYAIPKYGARGALSLALSSGAGQQSGIGEIRPGEDFGKLGEALLGKEPIQSVQTKAGMQSQKYEQKGIPGSIAGPLGGVVAFGGTLLDAIPFFPEGKLLTAANVIDKTRDVSKIYETAKDLGIADDIIQKNMPSLVSAEKGQAKQLLQQMRDEHNTLANASKIAQPDIKSVTEEFDAGKITAEEMGNKLKEMFPNKSSGMIEDMVTHANSLREESTPIPSFDTVTKHLNEMRDLAPEETSVLNSTAKETETVNKEVPFSHPTTVQKSEEIAKDISDELGGTYTQKSNTELAARASERVTADADAAKEFALTNSTDEAVATRVALEKKLSADYLAATDPAEKERIAKEAVDIHNQHARLNVEEGRAVQANALLNARSPEGVVKQVSSAIENYNKTAKKKLPTLTGEQYGDIVTKWDEIQKMPENSVKVAKTSEFLDDLERKIPAPIWRQLTSIWKAGLLTGISTHLVNMVSTAAHVAVETIKDLPATAIDAIIGKLKTGQRTKFTSLGKEAAGLKGSAESVNKTITAFNEGKKVSGATSQFGKFIDGVKNVYGGVDKNKREMELLDFSKTTFPDTKVGRVFEAYTKTIFGLLGMEDKIPFEYMKSRSLYEQGLAYMHNNGIKLSGAGKTQWLQDFIKDPITHVGEDAGKSIVANAIHDGLVGVFQNDTILNDFAQNLKSDAQWGAIPEIIIPFSKTPAAFANQMIAYSPIGLVRTIANNVRKGSFDQKAFSEGIARGVIGTAAAAFIGRELYKKGLISTNYPTDVKSREELKMKRQLANAVKIGGRWIPITTFGPMGHLLIIGAQFQKSLDETGSISNALGQAGIAGLKSVNETTFLKGLNAALDAYNDPANKGAAFIKNLAGSIVPTIVNDTAKASDKYQRDVNDTLDAIQSRIPGVREATVHKRLDVLGNPIPIEKSSLGEIVNLRQSKALATPITAEIDRLKEKNIDVRPTPLSQTISGIKLDDNEYYAYQRIYGNIVNEALNNLITSSAYKDADNTVKETMWNMTYTGAKEAVRTQVAPLLFIRRYNLPEQIDTVQLNSILKQLSGEKRFTSMNTQHQEHVIKSLMGMQ